MTTKIKIGIVGSRAYTNKRKVKDLIFDIKQKYGDETKGIISETGDCNNILKDLNEDQKQEVLNSLSSTLDDTSMTTIENKLCSINKLQNA